MNKRMADIIATIHKLEEDLEGELAHCRLEFAYTVENGEVRFKEYVLKHHKQMRSHWLSYILEARPLIVVTAPIIYLMILPFALLDLFVSLYQLACFPIYGVPTVRRRDYLVFDRSHLAYLNWLEQFNCLFCSYANGVIGYVREITARTEQYWCPIKHSRRVLGSHQRYRAFSDYGDAEGFQMDRTNLRKELKQKTLE